MFEVFASERVANLQSFFVSDKHFPKKNIDRATAANSGFCKHYWSPPQNLFSFCAAHQKKRRLFSAVSNSIRFLF
jgi:hypothetical protein